MDICTPRARSDSFSGHHTSHHSRGLSDFDVSSILLSSRSVNLDSLAEQHPAEAASVYETSWEPKIAQQIATKAKEAYNNDPKKPYMVALVGCPGSGKSASAFLLANSLEDIHGLPSMIMPHDGYHYPLDVLRLFQDPEDAIYRRGAPDTFDPHALHRDLLRIKNNDNDEDYIHLPGFDHSVGDPEPNRHNFDRHMHRVVICEGLYLLHDKDGWESVAECFDLTIFMDDDIDACIERLTVRNQCIPGYTPEEIAMRCHVVDRKNAELVMLCKDRANVVVKSRASGRPPSRMHSPKPSMHQFPEEPTMERALTLLSLKDTEQFEVEAHPDHIMGDWAFDITSRIGVERPQEDSIFMSEANVTARSRANSIFSETTEPPEPAAQNVGSWEPFAAEQILDRLEKNNMPFPFMCALVGCPGSGKTVSAFMLASKLEEAGYPTMIMPHDGYHYPLEYLKTFPDADQVIYRRGAPDTFDDLALARDLERIKSGTEERILLPAFDHSVGDPQPNAHCFDRNQHKIVLCEGLWLLHWESVRGIFDYSIFMESDIDVCVERVKIRNKCIPGYTAEQIDIRAEEVDRVNAENCTKSKEYAELVVQSMATKSAHNNEGLPKQ